MGNTMMGISWGISYWECDNGNNGEYDDGNIMGNMIMGM